MVISDIGYILTAGISGASGRSVAMMNAAEGILAEVISAEVIAPQPFAIFLRVGTVGTTKIRTIT